MSLLSSAPAGLYDSLHDVQRDYSGFLLGFANAAKILNAIPADILADLVSHNSKSNSLITI